MGSDQPIEPQHCTIGKRKLNTSYSVLGKVILSSKMYISTSSTAPFGVKVRQQVI